MGSAPASFAQGYDYVVVGGGTAGCVLANRLSADPGMSVLLLEAGASEGWAWHKPRAGDLYSTGNRGADWGYQTTPQQQLAGKLLQYPLARVLGGSSSIYGMTYLRGQKEDYESWASELGPDWSWNEFLTLFRELETHHGGASEFHGATGDWRVDLQRVRWEILEALRRAAIEAGIPSTDDFNTGSNEGCGYFEVNQLRGRRVSATDALLKPIAHRANLTIATQALVERIGIEHGKANVVHLQAHGDAISVRVWREVILAAGAIGSPCILQRSGVGPGVHLHSLGIPVVRDLPVGLNLQDHLQLRLVYRVTGAKKLNTIVRSKIETVLMAVDYALRRNEPLAMAPSQLGIFARSSEEHFRANLQFQVQPLLQPLLVELLGKETDDFPAISMSVCNLRPLSRGSVHVSGASAADAPVIDPQYLQHTDDQKVAVESLRLARRIMRQPAMSGYCPLEQTPGFKFESDEEQLGAAGSISASDAHPVGTCRMGCGNDAVVSSDFRVIGIAGLRVADASVMPSIISGNTNTPTAALALKAAKAILAEAGSTAKGRSLHPYDLFRTAIPLW